MTDTLPPPYPADTRAKGWRFELDYEKIEQSDTWGLTTETPVARPFLLMMWLVAWTQEPCGSLPNDEGLIRARCCVPVTIWPKVRTIMMRGWWLASDGRLYHDTLTKRVEEMIEYRRKNAKRVADFKAAKREQQGGNALPTHDSQGNNDTGTGTGTTSSPPSVKKKTAALPPGPSVADLVAQGFDEPTAADFIAHKAKVKAPLTHRAWVDHLSEATKAGWTPLAAAEKVMAKSWKGFEAKYVADESPAGAPQSSKTSFTRDREAQASAWMGSAAPQSGEVIDMEASNVTRLAVG